MQRQISVYAAAEVDEQAVHATMPPVRRTLPWRVRQQNLAYRLAERAGVSAQAVAARGTAQSEEASAHFSFGDQHAEYFFDVRELDNDFDDAFFRDEPRGDGDADCR